MPSVRSAPGFTDTDAKFLTFKYDSSIVYTSNMYDMGNHSAQVGLAVTLVSDSTVGLGSSGGILLGKLVSVEPDVCTVQVGGVIDVPYAAGTPPILNRGVTIDGTGKVTSAGAGQTIAESASASRVLSLDSTNLIAYVRLP